jgi:hypothetical protein
MKYGVIMSRQYPIEQFDVRYIGFRMYGTLRRYRKKILDEYAKTVKTWNHKPDFVSRLKFSGANPRISVYTDDEIYWKVDGGTEIRYDVMTHDPLYEPKTAYRVIDSFPGQGGFAYKDFDNPRDGIQARMFSDEITMRLRDAFFRELDRNMRDGLRKMKRLGIA